MSGNKSRKLRGLANHLASQNDNIDKRRLYQRLKVEYNKELKTIKQN
jgi:hypothetical protein